MSTLHLMCNRILEAMGLEARERYEATDYYGNTHTRNVFSVLHA